MLFRWFLYRAIFIKGHSNVDMVSSISLHKKQVKNCRITKSVLYIESIGEETKINRAICMGKINIGRFVNIFGPGTIISSIKSNIYISDFVSIGQNVSIQDSNHRLDRASTTFATRDIYGGSVMDDVTSKGDIIIEEDVWIGSNSVILSGVTVGRGAVIAAGSVVTKNVGRYEIVGGNPAKYIKNRFSETTIELLETEQWWNWSKEKILSNKKFFLEKIE